MSISKKTRTSTWWALNSTRARLTAVGASALALALLTTSVIVWTSPANPINQAIASRTDTAGKDPLVVERNQLLSKVVELQRLLDESKTSLTATKAEMASIQQALWSAEGQLEAASSGKSSKNTAAKKTTTKPTATTAAITAPSKAEIVNPAAPYFGLMTEQAPFSWSTYDATAARVGYKPDVVGYFGGWDEAFRANAVTRSWQRGTLPILTWESRPIDAKNNQVDEPDYTLPAIIGDPEAGVAGKYDDYLHQYARDIVATGLPLGIRLNHEMNGTWYPWSETTGSGEPINGNRVGDYAKMWQHVHDIFEAEGANDLVVWIWAPNIINNLSASHKSVEFMEGYYPGDEYVDWVGLSGYLRPPYKAENNFTFDYTFGASIDQLRQITDKPIFLAEIGASEVGGQKVQWVTSLFEGLARPENADILGFSWFNLAVTTYTEGELATNDWRIESRPESLAAFTAGLERPGSRFVLTPN